PVRKVMSTTPPYGLLDDVGGVLGPYEGRGVHVPLLDVPLDVPDHCADRVKGAAADRLAREDAEPRLNHVQPRGPCRREVQPERRASSCRSASVTVMCRTRMAIASLPEHAMTDINSNSVTEH